MSGYRVIPSNQQTRRRSSKDLPPKARNKLRMYGFSSICFGDSWSTRAGSAGPDGHASGERA
eukprot:11190989-Lingulodinium_polyedra.AAC.1